ASAAALSLAGASGEVAGAPEQPPLSRTRPARLSIKGRKPLAVVCTVYRPLSHAYHIAGRFLHGYARAGELHVPAHYIHSIYADQMPENDLSRELGRDFGIKVVRRPGALADALTSGGKLAVEGVLLIGEHGNYPRND